MSVVGLTILLCCEPHRANDSAVGVERERLAFVVVRIPILASLDVLRCLLIVTLVANAHARLHGERLGLRRVRVVRRTILAVLHLHSQAHEHLLLGAVAPLLSSERPSSLWDSGNEVDFRGVLLRGVEDELVVLLLTLQVE